MWSDRQYGMYVAMTDRLTQHAHAHDMSRSSEQSPTHAHTSKQSMVHSALHVPSAHCLQSRSDGQIANQISTPNCNKSTCLCILGRHDVMQMILYYYITYIILTHTDVGIATLLFWTVFLLKSTSHTSNDVNNTNKNKIDWSSWDFTSHSSQDLSFFGDVLPSQSLGPHM